MYYYWLKDVDICGHTGLHGSVEATAAGCGEAIYLPVVWR